MKGISVSRREAEIRVTILFRGIYPRIVCFSDKMWSTLEDTKKLRSWPLQLVLARRQPDIQSTGWSRLAKRPTVRKYMRKRTEIMKTQNWEKNAEVECVNFNISNEISAGVNFLVVACVLGCMFSFSITVTAIKELPPGHPPALTWISRRSRLQMTEQSHRSKYKEVWVLVCLVNCVLEIHL